MGDGQVSQYDLARTDETVPIMGCGSRPWSARWALGRAPGRASQGRAGGADAGPAAPRARQVRAGTEQIIEPGKSCRPKISRWGDPLCTDRWSGLRSASGSGGANRKNHAMSAHQVLRKAQPRVVAGGQPVISCTAPKPITGLLALPHQCGNVVGERGSAHRPARGHPGLLTGCGRRRRRGCYQVSMGGTGRAARRAASGAGTPSRRSTASASWSTVVSSMRATREAVIRRIGERPNRTI